MANFKETQLADDARRAAGDGRSRRARRPEFDGHVDSIAAATGAKFSLLPPENATGNYVKVVQRVPVKIVLEPGQDPDHRLRPGMSVHADGLHRSRCPCRSEHPHVNPWIVAVAVMFATFMEVLDTTVVNVSLPHIAGNLSATIDESTWVLTSYLVANAIVLPLTGWLATHFGRKRLLMTSVDRLHDCVAALRARAEPAAARRLPPDPGRDRRRDAAAVAGRPARGLPAAGSRQAPWASGASASSSRRSSGRCSAAG